MVDWKWLFGFATPLIIALIIAFYKIFERLTKLETDNVFTTKIIWEFLISKVHSHDNEYNIDELLDKWKNNRLRKKEEIELLVSGLNTVANNEEDTSRKAAAELLLKMINKGVGITVRL